jgi:hypothetical protein
MCKILANMTQVSDVAPGPLVFNTSSKCRLYRYICHGLNLQPYLTKPIPDQYKECTNKFRLSGRMLEIERGRYVNIPECNQKCKLCSNTCIDIEDEYHFYIHLSCI